MMDLTIIQDGGRTRRAFTALTVMIFVSVGAVLCLMVLGTASLTPHSTRNVQAQGRAQRAAEIGLKLALLKIRDFQREAVLGGDLLQSVEVANMPADSAAAWNHVWGSEGAILSLSEEIDGSEDLAAVQVTRCTDNDAGGKPLFNRDPRYYKVAVVGAARSPEGDLLGYYPLQAYAYVPAIDWHFRNLIDRSYPIGDYCPHADLDDDGDNDSQDVQLATDCFAESAPDGFDCAAADVMTGFETCGPDGALTAADVAAIIDAVAGKPRCACTEACAWGDINCDGLVSNEDAQLVQTCFSGGTLSAGLTCDDADVVASDGGCTPDGLVNDADLDAVRKVMTGTPPWCSKMSGRAIAMITGAASYIPNGSLFEGTVASGPPAYVHGTVSGYGFYDSDAVTPIGAFRARAITDTGLVLGFIPSPTRPVIWKQGSHAVIPGILNSYVESHGLNAAGVWAGLVNDTDEGVMNMLYCPLGGCPDLDVPGKQVMEPPSTTWVPFDMNSSYVVVGGDGSVGGARVWYPGVDAPRELSELICSFGDIDCDGDIDEDDEDYVDECRGGNPDHPDFDGDGQSDVTCLQCADLTGKNNAQPDGVIDSNDVDAVRDAYYTACPPTGVCRYGDINCDGLVNSADIQAVQNCAGSSSASCLNTCDIAKTDGMCGSNAKVDSEDITAVTNVAGMEYENGAWTIGGAYHLTESGNMVAYGMHHGSARRCLLLPRGDLPIHGYSAVDLRGPGCIEALPSGMNDHGWAAGEVDHGEGLRGCVWEVAYGTAYVLGPDNCGPSVNVPLVNRDNEDVSGLYSSLGLANAGAGCGAINDRGEIVSIATRAGTPVPIFLKPIVPGTPAGGYRVYEIAVSSPEYIALNNVGDVVVSNGSSYLWRCPDPEPVTAPAHIGHGWRNATSRPLVRPSVSLADYGYDPGLAAGDPHIYTIDGIPFEAEVVSDMNDLRDLFTTSGSTKILDVSSQTNPAGVVVLAAEPAGGTPGLYVGSSQCIMRGTFVWPTFKFGEPTAFGTGTLTVQPKMAGFPSIACEQLIIGAGTSADRLRIEGPVLVRNFMNNGRCTAPRGDVDNDGDVDMIDASLPKKCLLGLIGGGPGWSCIPDADIGGPHNPCQPNGVANKHDSTLILNILAGKQDCPACDNLDNFGGALIDGFVVSNMAAGPLDVQGCWPGPTPQSCLDPWDGMQGIGDHGSERLIVRAQSDRDGDGVYDLTPYRSLLLINGQSDGGDPALRNRGIYPPDDPKIVHVRRDLECVFSVDFCFETFQFGACP